MIANIFQNLMAKRAQEEAARQSRLFLERQLQNAWVHEACKQELDFCLQKDGSYSLTSQKFQ